MRLQGVFEQCMVWYGMRLRAVVVKSYLSCTRPCMLCGSYCAPRFCLLTSMLTASLLCPHLYATRLLSPHSSCLLTCMLTAATLSAMRLQCEFFVFNGIHEIMCHAIKASIRSGAYGESPRTAAEARAEPAAPMPKHKQQGMQTQEREERRGKRERRGGVPGRIPRAAP